MTDEFHREQCAAAATTASLNTAISTDALRDDDKYPFVSCCRFQLRLFRPLERADNKKMLITNRENSPAATSIDKAKTR